MAFWPDGGLRDGKEETQGGRDRQQASTGGSSDRAGPIGGGGHPVDWGNGSNISRWQSEYGGLKGDQVKRLKELEAENTRLRRVVSDLTLEKLILKEAASRNF
jgi:putative transposase